MGDVVTNQKQENIDGDTGRPEEARTNSPSRLQTRAAWSAEVKENKAYLLRQSQ